MPEFGAGVEKPELEALTKINYKPYYTPYDVWRDDPVHVQGLHTEASLEVMRLYGCLKRGEPVSNIVLEGRPGIGKTHFLGTFAGRGKGSRRYFRAVSNRERRPVLAECGRGIHWNPCLTWEVMARARLPGFLLAYAKVTVWKARLLKRQSMARSYQGKR